MSKIIFQHKQKVTFYIKGKMKIKRQVGIQSLKSRK